MLKKSLGQHLLVDRKLLKMEATLCMPRGKKVLEIGPGTGNLTEMLLAFGPKKLVCVEKDPDMASALEARFGASRNLQIVRVDFLEWEPDGDFDIVCGNLPYYISSKIIFKAAKMEFSRAVFCLQKEFAERIGAMPGERKYSRLSVQAGKAFDVVFRRNVPAGAFYPPPKVDSQIIALEKKTREGGGGATASDAFVTAIFSHRKKTLRAALAASSSALGMPKAQLAKTAESLPFSGRRVFQLGMEEIAEAEKAVRHAAKKAKA
ncbi:MAG: 16S rRNA (adenine(1518)-N(6)/adenine(1519)-N(6))-dimethyltransferase RsmA [Candidatus Micrarchaeia archaeon]